MLKNVLSIPLPNERKGDTCICFSTLTLRRQLSWICVVNLTQAGLIVDDYHNTPKYSFNIEVEFAQRK